MQPLQTGKYQIEVLSVGRMKISAATIFSGKTQSDWQEFCETGESNTAYLGVNCLLIRGEGINMLIDTGVGDKIQNPRSSLLLPKETPTLREQLKTRGLSTDDITHLLLTHLHSDHCGGSTLTEDLETRPTFRRAQIYIQQDEWTSACSPDDSSRFGYRVHDFLPLLETGNIRFINGDCEIVAGISTEVSGGHTAAHQIIRVKDSDFDFIFPADICPTPLHLAPGQREAFDLFPLVTQHARSLFLRRALQPRTLVAFSHSKQADFYQIEQDNNLYRAVSYNGNSG